MDMVKFGTKAETLSLLRGKIKYANLLPQKEYTAGQWNSDPSSVVNDLKEWQNWHDGPWIVRSSAKAEDSSSESLAGHFTSVGDLFGEEALIEAISTVVESFQGNEDDGNQFFIQPMLKNVAISGVAFTRNPSSGAYYHIINYDDVSGRTDTVTAGISNELKTYFQSKPSPIVKDKKFSGIISLLEELEQYFDNDALDVEFAIDSEHKLYLLQVRPLIIKIQPGLEMGEQAQQLKLIHEHIKHLNKPHPYLFGNRTIFGIMPDWNPAEIIGLRPHALALSLYKELITDNIWAYQRSNYGYKNLRSFPLLKVFGGLPYVDVRVSFSSFIPNSINSDFANRLVDYYLNTLEAHPHQHDKVEFEIIFSCYTFDLPERIISLRENEFSEEECGNLSEELRNLTNNIIDKEKGLWIKDIDKIHKLDQRLKTILDSELDTISKVYWLIEDCKRFGTLPFAGLARAGFVAVQLLDSMVSVGILNEEERSNFMNSLNTVSSNMVGDFNELNQEDFLDKYGHLRPGTYEILSPRYDEAPEQYFDWSSKTNNGQSTHKVDNTSFSMTITQLKKLETALKAHRLNHDVIGLFDFIKGAIEGREYAKFVFTKSISEILRILEEKTKLLGFSKEDISFADIKLITEMYASGGSLHEKLEHYITNGRKQFLLASQLTLPPLIFTPNDIYAFEIPTDQPNFITLKSVEAKVVFGKLNSSKLKGNIYMIPSADPGFDWIFSHEISGFITMYGGMNSHMAIRAGELGIPAIIGAGQILYEKWIEANRLYIDCANKKVSILP